MARLKMQACQDYDILVDRPVHGNEEGHGKRVARGERCLDEARVHQLQLDAKRRQISKFDNGVARQFPLDGQAPLRGVTGALMQVNAGLRNRGRPHH